MGKSDYVRTGFFKMENAGQAIDDDVEESTTTKFIPQNPPITKEVLEQAKRQGLAVETTTTTRRGGARKNTNGNGNGKHTPAVVPPPKLPAVELLESVVDNPDYELIGTQIQPDFIQNLEIPRLKMADLRDYMKAKFGGGKFRVQILQNGTPIPEDKNGVVTVNIPIDSKLPEKTEDTESIKSYEAQRKELAAKRKLEEEKAQYAAEIEEREKKKNVNPLEAKLEALAKQNEELNKKLDEERRARELAAIAKPQESAVDQLVKLSPLIAALAPIFKKEPDTAMADAVKEIARTNEKMIERQERMSKDMLATIKETNDKVLDTMKEKGDSTSKAIDLLHKMNDLQQSMMGGGSDDESKSKGGIDDIHPKHGWSNLWYLAKMVGDAIQNAGSALPQYLEMLSKATGKTPAQLTALAQNPPPAPTAQQLPTPKNTAPVFQPASMPQAVTPDLMKPSAITAKPASRNVTPIASAEMPTPAIAPVAETPLTTPTPLELPKIEIPKPLTDTEKDLFVQAEEVARIMRLDLETQRNEHQWVDAALALLHRDFLEKIAATNDQNERLRLIGEKVQPMQWAAISGMMVTSPEMPDVERDRNGTNYYNMLLALNALVEGFQNLKNEAAGKAVPAV